MATIKTSKTLNKTTKTTTKPAVEKAPHKKHLQAAQVRILIMLGRGKTDGDRLTAKDLAPIYNGSLPRGIRAVNRAMHGYHTDNRPSYDGLLALGLVKKGSDVQGEREVAVYSISSNGRKALAKEWIRLETAGRVKGGKLVAGKPNGGTKPLTKNGKGKKAKSTK